MAKRWGDVAVFLALTIVFSTVFHWIILSAGPAPLARHYVAGLMWCPGIAALLTVRLRRLDMASLGLGWGEGRWNLFGYVIPLAYALLAYLGIWLLGYGGFADAENLAGIAQSLGLTGAAPATTVLAYFFALAGPAFVSALATGLGEEIGWRGFLAPRLVGLLGFTGGTLAVGAIWAAWHLPLILSGGYNQGTEWWFAVPCFVAMVLGLSVIMTWLRLRSNSVWPCAILHGSHNLFVQAFFTPLTGARGSVTPYAVGEFGVAVPAVVVLVAIWFWAQRGRLAR